jgi:hypothetical protein
LIDRVVVPYVDFLERRERRLRVAAELGRCDANRTIEGRARPAVAETPPSEAISEKAVPTPSISRVDAVQ